jgi:endogenous inhibitor of DNA gyrase (YacG/DUF329 family)
MSASAKCSCPICKKPVAPRAENASFPFCSGRCKTIDLGRWVNEEYRIPVTEDEDEDGERVPTLGRPMGDA